MTIPHFKAYLLMALFVWAAPNAFAQTYRFEAQRITTDDGLANLMTTSIYRSSQGFVWVNTRYGLNRYDGTGFKLYTREQNALATNHNILKMGEDAEGNLWLFHKGGYSPNHLGGVPDAESIQALDIFDPAIGRATPFDVYFSGKAPFRSTDICMPKIIDPKGRLWIFTNKNELYLYDRTFKKVFQKNGGFFQYISIDSSDNIWAGREKTLFCFNSSGEILEDIQLPEPVCGVYPGAGGTVWVSTITRNIFKIWRRDKDGTLSQLSLTRNGSPVTVKMFGAVFTYRSPRGFWYIEMDGEFHVFDERGIWLHNFNAQLGEGIKTMSTNYFEDDAHLWLATPTGIIQTSITESRFRFIHKKEKELSNCRGIAEDKAGHIYFLNTNLYEWDSKAGTCEKRSNTQGAFALAYLDSMIWVGDYADGTSGYSLDLRNNQEHRYPVPGPGSNHAYHLIKSKSPGLLLAATNQGLYYVDIINKRLVPFLKYNGFDQLRESEANFIHQNKAGIWLATSSGVFLMNEEEGVLRQYNTASGDLPFDYIQHIHEDKEGVFWLATRGGGILQWRPSTQKGVASQWRQFTVAQGLSNNYTYAIYEEDEKLWIPSDKGLMWMDKKTFRLRTFGKEDGLPDNEFNKTAHYRAKDGTLYFGGIGGLISFRPKDFKDDWANNTPLEITSCFLLEGGATEMTDKTGLLQNSGFINIRPSDKFLEIHFNLLDFDQQERHHYAYQIGGYSDNWNYINENFIRITNLPYGDYTLRVQGQSSSGGWSERELAIGINMLKPFYLRWWFFAGLFLLSVCAIVAGVRWRVASLKKDRKRLESEVEKRTLTIQQQSEELKVLDVAKTNFFSNITHEFRTPLTLIIGPLEQAVDNPQLPSIFKKRLKGVLKNAHHLLGLINQMLDLSKIESGSMQMEVKQGDLVQYTKDLVDRFLPLAQKNQQRLAFICPMESWPTFFDPKKWDKIIYNLLSNAFKFTPGGNDIQVCLMKTEKDGREMIRLDVRDTGTGIAPEHLGQIFNRFYQADNTSTRKQEGTGIGLALVKELVELQKGEIQVSSQVGQGTSFEIWLPVMEGGTSGLFEEATINVAMPDLFLYEESIQVTEGPVSTNGQSKTDLLIIEDNGEMREYIRQCVDASKYNIIEASDGEEGLEKALALVPDLIISDVMMPKKDGFGVLQEIRQNIATSHIPVILLTAKSSLDSRLEGLRKGADAYLTKPFSPQELALRIERLIEVRRQLQQRYQSGQPIGDNETYQKEDAFITDLRTYIAAHLDDPNLNGDTIGHHFAMSRVHLFRKMKALTDLSISDMVRTTRLNRAVELIKKGERTFSEIAYETGFTSLSHFSRVFKTEFGKSPSEMKQDVKHL